MQTFTAITPSSLDIPLDLALLVASVRADEPSAPGEYVGNAEGVLLNNQGRIVAFILRLSAKLAAYRPRTLVSASAVTIDADTAIHLAWTEEQILAQPRLDENLQPHNRVDGGP